MDVKIEIKKEPLDSISEQNSTHDEQASKFHESQNIHLNVQTGIEVDPLDVLEQDLTCDEEVTSFKKSQMVENKQCQRDEASDPEENMKNCGKKFYHESSRKRFTCSECNNKYLKCEHSSIAKKSCVVKDNQGAGTSKNRLSEYIYLEDFDANKNHNPGEENTGVSFSSLSSRSDKDPSTKTKVSLRDQEKINRRKRNRWVQANPSSWKRNVEKTKRQLGFSYESTQGKSQAPKVPKTVDCSKCKFGCSSKFSDEERQTLCKLYWKMDYESKKDFILSNVISGTVLSRRPRKEDAKLRSDSKKYFFSKNGESLRVCQQFFCKTLAISNIPILTAFKNVDEFGHYKGQDRRGKSIPTNKTPDEILNRIREHIQSFPTTESHNSGKTSKRLYLDYNLNITKMHSLFDEQCKKSNKASVSMITYRRLFFKEYPNLSFFNPKKDQCLVCSTYMKSSDAEKISSKGNYESHIKIKEAALEAKSFDKKRALEDIAFSSITFGLQSVLQIPSSDINITYYHRKLNLNNFTIYEASPPNDAYCYFWTETNGKRGSCEIGTCLGKYINSLPSYIKHITMFSDTCEGLNRNIQVSAFLLELVKNHPTLEEIEQKFLESGHSFVEVDSMYSAIECAKKNMDISSVHEWKYIFKIARKENPYKTNELFYKDFLDLKKLAQCTVANKNNDVEGTKVNWLKIKRLRYEKKKPWIIGYSYDFSSEYHEINIQQKKVGTLQYDGCIELLKLYDKQLPITETKKKDLLTLCKKGVILDIFHNWFEELPSSKNEKDIAGDSSYESEEEGYSE